MPTLTHVVRAAAILTAISLAIASPIAQGGRPRVVVISLDGARPALVEEYLKSGVLDDRTGLGRLRWRGISAEQSIPVTPSVTAASHIAIATGSTSAHNNIPANTFHPVAAPIATSVSGFAAPIGGYSFGPLGPSPTPTAEPLWMRIRAAGGKVVTATWPGGDGAPISITGTLVQAATPTRTVDYTVPFGAFGGLGAQGFGLTAANFVPADTTLVNQLLAAGRTSLSPVMVTSGFVESVFCVPAPTVAAFNPCGTDSNSGRTRRYDIRAAALDTINDGLSNYDTMVFFDAAAGVLPGPFALPATGPAYAKVGGPSAPFFYEGSGNVVGAAYFVSRIDPGLTTVRFARYSANFVPRNSAVLSSVNDVNTSVGFWAPQPDFRIPERISPGFGTFPDIELEGMYLDQIRTFTAYQTRVALLAIRRVPDADLVMVYFEQPDGSGHQFTITDKRQATNPLDSTSVGRPSQPFGATGQDLGKIARYDSYLKFAYQTASNAVEAVINEVGINRDGEPMRDVFVVSDHGMAPFHTAVHLGNLLTGAGITTSQLGLRTTGPAVNIYVNLAGREQPSGTQVSPAAYQALVDSVATALRTATDPNPFFNPSGRPLFSKVWTRPSGCGQPGRCTDELFGQDTGDVLALMDEGYNFDGTQTPVVLRLGDGGSPSTAVFSVPNFYGAHGHDSELRSMSSILYAAGPSLKRGKKLDSIRSVDIAPTILDILGVAGAPTIDGQVIPKILKKDED